MANNSRNSVVQVNGQLLAVCHPGCICPCKNKTVHISVDKRDGARYMMKEGRKEDTRGEGSVRGKERPRWKYCFYNFNLRVGRSETEKLIQDHIDIRDKCSSQLEHNLTRQ